jgi:hypothetical protein
VGRKMTEKTLHREIKRQKLRFLWGLPDTTKQREKEVKPAMWFWIINVKTQRSLCIPRLLPLCDIISGFACHHSKWYRVDSQKTGMWLSKWPPLSLSVWKQEGSQRWYLPVFHAGVYPKFKGSTHRCELIMQIRSLVMDKNCSLVRNKRCQQDPRRKASAEAILCIVCTLYHYHWNLC